jgi:hypothetical protein
MATNILRAFSLDNAFNTAIDPNGKTILDPYTCVWTVLPYFLRNSSGQTLRIDAKYIGVPDLVSWDFYGTHDLWWPFCIANQFIFPDKEMVSGFLVFIPKATDIQTFYSQVVQILKGDNIVAVP